MSCIEAWFRDGKQRSARSTVEAGKLPLPDPPPRGELEVTETDPGFKGDTATNVTKPATVETGAEIKVPLFINTGDKVKIDTRTGEYLERARLRSQHVKGWNAL